MPAGRPVKNLEPHKEALIGLFREGTTYEDLKEWLGDQGTNVSVRTIKGTFKKWEVGRRLRTDVAEAVKFKIQYYFLEDLADDSTILQKLQKDGYFIGKWTLVRLRFELGLRRRVQGVEAQAKADALIHEANQKQFNKEIEIEKKTNWNKAQESSHKRKSTEPLFTDRKRKNLETAYPRQELSPRTRHTGAHTEGL